MMEIWFSLLFLLIEANQIEKKPNQKWNCFVLIGWLMKAKDRSKFSSRTKHIILRTGLNFDNLRDVREENVIHYLVKTTVNFLGI